MLDENRKLIEQIDRRGILRGAMSLGALTMLTGCNVTDRGAVQSVLRAVSEWNDGVQAFLFNPNKLAPTYTEAQVLRPPRYNAYYEIDEVKPVDVASWKLELSGLIGDKRSWTAQQIFELPEQELIVRHICVEGWDYIGQWSGPNLRQFLERVGADLTAKYVMFRCGRRLFELDRHGDGAASADHSGDQIRQASRSPTRSAFRCGCGPRPSSASRTRNGSPRSRSPTPIPAAIGRIAASTGTAGCSMLRRSRGVTFL